jgi:class 3 adenylate cyclase/tetratricopeptide (TPR) repeat protein
VLVCAHCGTENPGEARFCLACGAALRPEATPIREERKVVTVLFCDLIGFTSRSEQLDPEDVSAMLASLHARLRTELERHGGTVEKFIGDAVMAVFGAPAAHEDDPERAVRAALAIRDELQEEGDLDVRIGVNTGEALVRLGARPLEGEGMIAGDVVNTASRLQTAAPVNGILVGEATYRATQRVIDYRDAPPVIAKGKAEPIHVWRALEARSRVGVDVRQQGRTPLVGRKRELDLLSDALQRAREEREPQLVTLVGVPGIGKSRLVWELFQRVDADPAFITWRQGRSLPYGEGVSFWALSEMVKAQAGILESDSVAQAAEKLEGAIAGLDVQGNKDWLLRHIRPLVGLETDAPPADAGEAFGAWRRFFEALAEQQPLVLIFEDLHWADEGLLDFVDELVDTSRGAPLLVVGTARPELLFRRSGWGGGKANALTISLSPLSDEDTARLASAVLDRSVVPAELQAALLARAGGNPLFAEEFARLAAERGGNVELPDTVHALIAARLDALPDFEKELLQTAAVVGKVFWVGALGNQATDAHLAALERKDFIRRERRSSVANETEYAFRHVLTRDVAYAQLPRAGRAQKHQATAAWIESLSPDRAEDRADMLAHHYSSALEYTPTTGEERTHLAERARLAFREAGDRSAALSALAGAARYYRAALELWPADDAERPRLLLAAGRAASLGEESGMDELEAAAAGLLEQGETARAAEAEALAGGLRWRQGRHADAMKHYERAESLITPEVDSEVKAFVIRELAGIAMVSGQDDRAIELAKDAGRTAAAFGLAHLQVEALTTIGSALSHRGDRRSIEHFEQALELARRSPTSNALRTYSNFSVALMSFGDLSRSAEVAREGLAQAERFGVTAHARWLRGTNVFREHMLGNWDEAIREADAFLEEARSRGGHYLEPGCHTVRAFVELARGELAGALEDSAAAVALARQRTDPQVVHPNLAARALLLQETGRENEAAEIAEELLALWELAPDEALLHGAPDLALMLSRVAWEGRLKPLIEKRTQLNLPWIDVTLAFCDRQFVRAAEMWAEMGARTGEAYARLRAAEELLDEGRHAEADVELRSALAFYRSVGATRLIREGERLLAESA